MTKHDKTLPASAKAIMAAGRHLQTKDAGDPFDLLSKKFGDLTDETLKRIGKTDQQLAEVAETLATMDQKMARGFTAGGPVKAPTWGEELTETMGEQIKALSESNAGRVGLNVKSTLTTGPTSAGALSAPDRDTLSILPRQRLTVRNLLNVVSIGSGSVEYPVQTTQVSPAGMAPEGTLKAEAGFDYELRTTSAKVIAHWIKASRQVLEDSPQLRDLIDSELRYGLALKEEQQLLNGDGTGSNLLGMVTQATAFAPLFTAASPTMIDTIGLAILQSALADFPATGVVMHPADWARMRLLKDADGHYLLGDPQAVVQPSLFGLPVVATKAMTVDQFLVGDFASAATLYDRWQPRVEVGYVGDDFVKNLTTVLAEERIAFAVKHGEALTYGAFENA